MTVARYTGTGSAQADDDMQAEGNALAVKGHITGQVLAQPATPFAVLNGSVLCIIGALSTDLEVAVAEGDAVKCHAV